MISHQHKTIFVHIPKVAGQSIEHMFLNDLGLDWQSRETLLLRPKRPEEKGPERLAHLLAKEYVSYGYIDQGTFDTYFKFSFVRNPYKRVVSFYNFLGYNRIISFRTFVKKVLPKKLALKDFFFQSQYDFLFDDNNTLLVDFVGKLESIDSDIEEIIKRSHISKGELPHVNKSKGEWKRGIGLLIQEPELIFSLSPKFTSYRIEKIEDDLKKAIFTLYQKDFESFNYQM